MGIFTSNTMAKFRNQLAQPLQLDGDWQVALASISFPSNINNVNSAGIVAYVSSGAELDASHNRTGQLRRIRKGIYNSSEELLKEIFRIAQLKNFDYDFDTVTQKLVLLENGHGIPLSEFANHYIMVFDLTSTQEATHDFIHPELTNSSLSVELKFDAALAHNVEIFFLGEKASTIYIDSARNASKNALPMITY